MQFQAKDADIDTILELGERLIRETDELLSLYDDELVQDEMVPSSANVNFQATFFHFEDFPVPCVSPERSLTSISSNCSAKQESVDLALTKEEGISILKDVGRTLQSKYDPYIDVSGIYDPGVPLSSRGGFWELFPSKLQRVLQDAEREGFTDIVGFQPHGRAFTVRNMGRFLAEILPRYFNGQTRLSSFNRQLNLYGFLRVRTGPDEGAYFNPLFLRGKPNLCRYMRRVGTPHGRDRRKMKQANGQDPDFYVMCHL